MADVDLKARTIEPRAAWGSGWGLVTPGVWSWVMIMMPWTWLGTRVWLILGLGGGERGRGKRRPYGGVGWFVGGLGGRGRGRSKRRPYGWGGDVSVIEICCGRRGHGRDYSIEESRWGRLGGW